MAKKETLSRREFLGAAAVLTGAAATGGCGSIAGSAIEPEVAAAGWPMPKRPSDVVPLGKSGVRISVVGIGTGSGGWAGASNQTRLGQAEFTRLIRHSLDGGIIFFDLADQYGSHPYFREAMKGVPRDRYVIQTKSTSREPERARADVDRFLKELGTDYIDSLIIHNVTDGAWTTKYRGVMDVFEEAREAGKTRSHGVTCHSFEALEAAEASDWVQVNQVRFNPKGSHMDADPETAKKLFAKMRAKGQGMIGMKVVGQGDIVENGSLTPHECFRFQLESGVVDAFCVGVQKLAHVDDLLHGTQLALNEVGYRQMAYA
jgi:aryl-alcohol dehydrogenase-like predicted oxidoreductase